MLLMIFLCPVLIFVQTSVSGQKWRWVDLFVLIDFNTIKFNGRRITWTKDNLCGSGRNFCYKCDHSFRGVHQTDTICIHQSANMT